MEENQRRTRDADELWFEASDASGEGRGDAPHLPPRQVWRTSRRLTLFLLGLLAVLLLALIYLRDDEPPWDQDLLPPILTNQPMDASAPARMKAMLSAAAKIPDNDPTLASPWEAKLDALSALLDRHTAVLENYRDLADERDEQWQPRSLLWKIEDLGSSGAWKKVLLLKAAEAVHLARRDQEDQAFLAAIDMSFMGCMLEQLDAWPSFMERALDCHERGSETLVRLLMQTKLPEDMLRRLQEQEFRPCAPSVERLGAAMNGFYAYERKLLLGPVNGEPAVPAWYLPARSESRVFFKPNATMRLFTESFRELKSETSQTVFTRSDQIGTRLGKRLSTNGLFSSSNRAGNDYFATRIRFYDNLPDRLALARARHAVTLTLFAVRRFVMHESRLPTRLEELLPNYLAKLPLDPFSGEPVHYNAARGLLYSVGTNLRDEGGKPQNPPLSDLEEPTAEIGIPVAKVKK